MSGAGRTPNSTSRFFLPPMQLWRLLHKNNLDRGPRCVIHPVKLTGFSHFELGARLEPK
jgi:hypothetical protein